MNAATCSEASSESRPLTRAHSRAWAGRAGSTGRPEPGDPDVAHLQRRPLAGERVGLAVAALADHVDQVEGLLGRQHVGHLVGVLEAVLGPLEVGRLEVDRPAVLAGHHPPGRERAAVAQALDVVDDRHGVVAGAQEVGVQRVHDVRRVDRPDPGQQRLGGDLAAEDALPVGLRLAAAVEVDVDQLEVEELDAARRRRLAPAS